MNDIDVLIVGAGPAGVSTALHLLGRDPGLRDRILVIDKAGFPRDKLCGGGITRMVDRCLANLGLRLEVPSTHIDCARMIVGGAELSFRSKPAFRVIRRAEFDHWLVRHASDCGIAIHQRERLMDLHPDQSGVDVTTSRSTYRAAVVVGADGSSSTVRRRTGLPVGRRARLLEVLTPERDHNEVVDAIERSASFDFGNLRNGCQGYVWDFPCHDGGAPTVNRGIIDVRIDRRRKRVRLDELFAFELKKRDWPISDVRLRGAGLRWYQPLQPISKERVVLVGDAAGVDPLFGEGIPFALAYGELASHAIVHALTTRDFRFLDYRWRVLRSSWGRNLLLRRGLAELSYRPLTQPLVMALWRTMAKLTNNSVDISPPPITPVFSAPPPSIDP